MCTIWKTQKRFTIFEKRNEKRKIMKIKATEIKPGMTIKFHSLFDMNINPERKKNGVDWSIQTHRIGKRSPEYKVLNVSEIITTGAHRTRFKTIKEKHIEIVLKDIQGICEISPKQNVVLVSE